MNIRSLQGLLLILSALATLVGFFGPDTPLFSAILTISTILFILGISAVYTSQPIGTAGLIGVALMILAAVIALGFDLFDAVGTSSAAGLLIATSTISGLVGRLLVGWLTTRHRVFPAWAGWTLIAEGVLSAAFGVFDFGALSDALTVVVILLGVVALLGYGFYLLRPRPVPAFA